MLNWQRTAYGDSPEVRRALDVLRRDGWPVDTLGHALHPMIDGMVKGFVRGWQERRESDAATHAADPCGQCGQRGILCQCYEECGCEHLRHEHTSSGLCSVAGCRCTDGLKGTYPGDEPTAN